MIDRSNQEWPESETREISKHFHVWIDGRTQVFSPLEAIIGRLRNEHALTRREISHDRCFAVLDAIGICVDLENGRPVEYLTQA